MKFESAASVESQPWKGHKVPLDIINARFDIGWMVPIGVGGYGDIYEVCVDVILPFNCFRRVKE
jgi:hypothetical protein